jgi:hypothetical protein
MTFGEWEEAYRPQKNDLGRHGSFDGYMFETYGKEQDKAWSLFQKEPERVWTVVEGSEDQLMWIMPGWHRVNRFGHFVCDVPCSNDNIQVCDDPEAWFKSLRRDGQLRQMQQVYDFSAGMQEELKSYRASRRKKSSPQP